MSASKNAIEKLMEQSVLASPPDLLFKIISSLDSELSSHQIGEIIGHDQSISAQVLKLSNSSFFGFKGSIKTLDRAINILGTKTVRNIAVTTLLFAHTNKIRLWNLDIMEFWLHSFLVADITREIAQKAGLDGDEGYIAGLLHDIGKLILYSQRQEKADLFHREHYLEDIDEYERRTWGIDSAELGKRLLEKWNIPAEIADAISGHKDLGGCCRMAKIIFLANEFASVATDFHFKSRLSYPIFRKLLSEIKINDQTFDEVCQDIPNIVERGKLIMKVMSKNQSFSIRRRVTTHVSLVAPSEYGLSRCLLELMGFKVEVVTPAIVKAYDEAVKLQLESAAKKAKAIEEGEVEEKPKAKSKAPSFLRKLFGKKMEKREDEESEEEAGTQNVSPINWRPLVIFDQVEPFKINRLGLTILQVMRNPADMKETPIPVFFTNPDIKVK